MTEVKPGQVWADNDPRSAGRTLRVERIEGDKVVCEVLSNSEETQKRLDRIHRGAGQAPAGIYTSDRRGKTTRISLSRFKPTSTGYRLVSGGED